MPVTASIPAFVKKPPHSITLVLASDLPTLVAVNILLAVAGTPRPFKLSLDEHSVVPPAVPPVAFPGNTVYFIHDWGPASSLNAVVVTVSEGANASTTAGQVGP